VPEYLSKTYPVLVPRVLVPRVDSDGNEIAGIRLPDVAVPTGTATGWALRAPDVGGAGELCTQDGSFIPFAKTKTEREDKGDPRLSIEERYQDKADFVAKVRNAALALERGGYLLAEDVKHIADKAAALIW
jgi:Alpha/beta hydrolase domain